MFTVNTDADCADGVNMNQKKPEHRVRPADKRFRHGFG